MVDSVSCVTDSAHNMVTSVHYTVGSVYNMWNNSIRSIVVRLIPRVARNSYYSRNSYCENHCILNSHTIIAGIPFISKLFKAVYCVWKQ